MEWWFQLPTTPPGVGVRKSTSGVDLVAPLRARLARSLHGERLAHELFKCILHVVLVQKTHVVHRYVRHGPAT